MLPWQIITLPEEGSAAPGGAAGSCPRPSLQIAVHPATAGRLVVIYPGLDATLDGESRALTWQHPYRYRRLAETLRQSGIAAVVRLPNPRSGYNDGGDTAVECLRRAIDHALSHAVELCGYHHPTLCLWGFSAGAGAAAALASDYQPQRLLLFSPAWNVGHKRILGGLKEFKGELLILVGARDELISPDAANLFEERALAVRRKQRIVVPGCDHFFSCDEHDALLHKTTLREFEAAEPPRHKG